MAAWPSCRGPRQPAANELGGGPIHHVRPTEIERLAGPSAPRSATPELDSDVTPRKAPRAERRSCTRLPAGRRLFRFSGARILLETGADLPIGYNVGEKPEIEGFGHVAGEEKVGENRRRAGPSRG